MKYIVAVSGGVDSVVLLDMLVKENEHKLIVAHFDHGIRDDSAADARFVERLSANYGLQFVTRREELGASVSEASARERRYIFLQSLAEKHNAKIVVAHHQNDIIETIAINVTRGTGWRGLAVMGNIQIERPLKSLTKSDIYNYALENKLEWVEDETNLSDLYLRNRLRHKLTRLDDAQRTQLTKLHELQVAKKLQIDSEAVQLVTNSRYFLTMLEHDVAIELLRSWLEHQGLSLDRPQRSRLLHAVKTARPGQIFEAGSGIRIEFTLREFIVKNPL